MAVVFMEIGQDVHFQGGFLEEAIQEGVRQGYAEGFLRKSVVKDPISGRTPETIHLRWFIMRLCQGMKCK